MASYVTLRWGSERSAGPGDGASNQRWEPVDAASTAWIKSGAASTVVLSRPPPNYIANLVPLRN